MQKCHCIIGTYNHIPEGAEESSFEETYQICWRPFLSALYRFPDISAVLHYSGTALAWLEARHPEFLMLLEEMAARKQIELLGGGFFAPLLPLVPGPDRLGQIELLTTWIRKAFGRRPRGCWVQEYAWEASLASSLQTSGFEYTFLSERQFREAGVDLGAPALTEDQGKTLTVFPCFDALESFPVMLLIHEAVAAMRDRHDDLPLITILYPGESARELWEKSGLESPDVLFESSFAALQKESLNCETTTPSKYLKSPRPMGRGYFPSGASSLLMGKGPSSPASKASKGKEETLPALGSPRSILLRNEESLALYAKMHYVRILVGQLRGDKSRKKSAQEELWRGQCGDAYWPSLNGGLSRLPIRAAAYSALIDAEKTTRQRGGFSPGVIMADIDFDGAREILFQGSDFNAYIHQREGSLFELDSLKTKTNYANVLASALPGEGRRPSAASFQDRFCKGGQFGADISLGQEGFALEDSDRPAHQAVLTRDLALELGGKKKLLFLRKKYVFRKVALSVVYELANRESEALSFRCCTELKLAAGSSPEAVGLEALATAAGAKGGEKAVEKLVLASDAKVEAQGLDLLRITNARAEEQLELRADRPFHLVARPLWHEARIHGEKRQLYEGASFLLGWDLTLPADSSIKLTLTLEIRS